MSELLLQRTAHISACMLSRHAWRGLPSAAAAGSPRACMAQLHGAGAHLEARILATQLAFGVRGTLKLALDEGHRGALLHDLVPARRELLLKRGHLALKVQHCIRCLHAHMQ
jgi:hypothetical protein